VITPFGSDPIDSKLTEGTVLYVSRLLHTMDRTAYETALQLARVEAHRQVAVEAAEATRKDRENQRGIARVAAATMTPEDMAAIHKVATERRCSGIEAAVIVGAQRAAQADEQ
jgi:hypothetical protein